MTSVSILLVINIFSIFFAADMGLSNIGDVVVNALFGENSLDTTNPEINSQLDNGIQKDLNQQVNSNDLLSFVDGLKMVFSFIITLLTMGFALMNMLIQTNAPILITWVLGLVSAIGFYISIVSAIRGFSA